MSQSLQSSQGIYEAVTLQYKYYDYMQAMAMERERKEGLRWHREDDDAMEKGGDHLFNMEEEPEDPFKVHTHKKKRGQI